MWYGGIIIIIIIIIAKKVSEIRLWWYSNEYLGYKFT
jgi:hypothetical protein